MIKHDGEWLDRNNASPTDAILCVRYFDHVTRWRTMDEVPEIGDRIEVHSKPIGTLSGEECSADVFEYEGTFFVDDERKPLFWRPAPLGELPEVAQ